MFSLIANPTLFALLENPSPLSKCCFYPITYPNLKYHRLHISLFCVNGPTFGKRSSMCSRCISEGDKELEDKILDFMEKSDHPKRFPTKKELVSAGRFDLVEDIKRRGGWFSLGWEDIQTEVDKVEDCEILAMESDIEQFKKRLECSDYVEESAQALPSPTSSARSLEIANEEGGVEGILIRLQRERDSSLGIDTGRYGGPQTSSMDGGDHWKTSTSADRIDPGKNGSVMSGGSKKGASYDTDGHRNHYTKSDSWKVWSIQRAGAQITEFEGLKEINQDEIQTRLKQLESELFSSLQSLRFVKDGSLINKGKVSSSSELQKLYDECEFQETEVMNAKEKLRVLHAKLAILEGKRSLSKGKEKNTEILNQRRLEGARKALQLLRTTTIIWQNSASEVILTGSYDGWTSQRKMEKSSSGIFCASLRLYPGRYEIKFIVDGIWRVDPLRPMVHNNGYENNLLIIT